MLGASATARPGRSAASGRACPEPIQVFQRIPCVIELKFDAVEVMRQVELTTVLVIAVDYRDERSASICQTSQQLLLHLGELPAFDLVDFTTLIISKAEELVFSHKIECETFINEGQIVVNLPNFEDFFAPQSGIGIPVAPRGIVIAVFILSSKCMVIL